MSTCERVADPQNPPGTPRNLMKTQARPVAVIGGAGFIGLHVCRELRRRDIEPWIVDTHPHLERSREAARAVAGAVCPANVRDEGEVARAISGSGITLVINLATVSVRYSLREPHLSAANLIAVGSAVPLACVAAGVVRYVYVSSSDIYGEAVDGPLRESNLPHPRTIYGAGKLAGEHCAAVIGIRHGLEITIVRPFNVYGPGCHIGGTAGEAIPRWIAQVARGESLTIHGDGAQTRDYTFVEDIARGIVDAALSNAAANSGPINLCSGVERSVLDIARAVAQFDATKQVPMPVGGAPRPCDLRRQVGCAARAQSTLRWEPRVSWEEGLRRTREDVLARLAGGEWADVPEKTWT